MIKTLTNMIISHLFRFGLLSLFSCNVCASICGVPEQVCRKNSSLYTRREWLTDLDRSLQVGDVWVELPGKAGTVISPQSVPAAGNMTSEQIATIGLGTNGTLPIPLFIQLNDEFMNSSDAAFVPPDVIAELKLLNDFYTTERAGMVICDVYTSPAGTSSRAWRPYNLTRGWHSALWGTCNPSKGWSSSGIDASVDLVGECNPDATKCLWVQTFRPGTEQFGAALQSVSVKVRSALTEAQIQSCCFPSSEAARDCSAVEDVVSGYDVAAEDYSIFAASSSAVASFSAHVAIFVLIFFSL